MKLHSKSIFLILWAIVVLVTSCCSLDHLSPPYLITESKVVLGAKEQSYNVAGAYITVYNNSDKTISSLTLSFCLYDSDGNAEGIGTNCVASDYNKPLAPKSSVTVIVSIDDLLGCSVADSYLLDYVYVPSITYSDGSTWKDTFGLYTW